MRALFILTFISFFSCVFGQKNSIKPSIAVFKDIKVNSFTGNLSLDRTLFSFNSIGPDLNFTCNYLSNSKNDFGLGVGWTWNMNKYYKEEGSNLTIYGTNGGSKTFTNVTNTWVAEEGVFDTLISLQDGYKIIDKEGNSCYFNNINKKISKIEDMCGATLSFFYNDTILIKITDHTDRNIEIEWNNGKINKVYHNLLNSLTEYKFEYENEYLRKITNPLGYFMQLNYSDNNKLIGVIDEKGTPLSISYHSTGGVKLINSCDVVKSFSYNQKANETYVIDQLNGIPVITTYQFNETGRMIAKNGNCCGYNQKYTYDNNNNIIKKINGLNQTQLYEYDQKGNKVKETNSNGKVMSRTFNEQNKITTIKNELNFVSNYAYDNKGNLILEVDALGNQIIRTYNNLNLLTSETDKNGYLTQYNYNNHGYLNSITFADTSTILYTYDNVGNIISETDENGNTTQYQYDKLNNLTKEIDSQGNNINYIYDADNNPITIIDQLGHTTILEYNGLSQVAKKITPEGIIEEYNYDSNGNLSEKKDGKGYIYKYEYNERNQVIKETDPLGNALIYEYDEGGNKVKETDKLGNFITYTYDNLNQVIQKKLPGGEITNYIYDDLGRLIQETNALGNSIYFEYDALGRKTKEIDALGQFIQNIYDNNNNLIQKIDKKGIPYSYIYNNRNRLIQLNNPLNQTIKYKYDKVGNQKTVEYAVGIIETNEYNNKNLKIKRISPTGLITQYHYDIKGRLIKEKLYNQNEINYIYDKNDRLIEKYDNLGLIYKYKYDKNNNIILNINEDSLITKYEYNALNLPTKTIDSMGSIIKYGYDLNGRLIKQISPLNEISLIEYNSNALPIKLTNAAGNFTIFNYNALGAITNIIDPKGNNIQYQYDFNGRKNKVIYPDGLTREYTFDSNDNVTNRKDRNGVICTYQYDALNRQTSKNYPDNTSCTFQYDNLNRMISANNPITLINFTYDNENRLLVENVGNKQIIYSYDDSLYSKTITYPSGISSKELLDQRNRIISISNSSTNLATLNYQGNKIKEKIFNNSIVVDYTYNAVGALKSIISNNDIVNLNYIYDSNSNVISKKNNVKPDKSAIYTYDNQNQIQSSKEGEIFNNNIPNPIHSQNWNYDKVGNRKTDLIENIGHVYSCNIMNQYIGIQPGHPLIQYDINGNLINDGDDSYIYDYDNRIKSINNSITFYYDALGRKYRQIKGSKVDTFYYYADQIVEVKSSSDTSLYYFYAGESDYPIALQNNESLYYLQEDNLGNIINAIDTNGNVVEKYYYDAFGNTLIIDSFENEISKSDIDNILLFNSKEYLGLYKIYNYRNRTYSPELGRFLQKDPIGYEDDLNLYTYVKNNPLNYIDQYGLFKSEVCFKQDYKKKFDLFRKSHISRVGLINQLGRIVNTGDIEISVKHEFCEKCCEESGLTGIDKKISISLSGSIGSRFNALEFIPQARVTIRILQMIGIKPFIGGNISINATGQAYTNENSCGKKSGGGCLEASLSISAIGEIENDFIIEEKGIKKGIKFDVGVNLTTSINTSRCVVCSKSECKYNCETSLDFSGSYYANLEINYMYSSLNSNNGDAFMQVSRNSNICLIPSF